MELALVRLRLSADLAGIGLFILDETADNAHINSSSRQVATLGELRQRAQAAAAAAAETMVEAAADINPSADEAGDAAGQAEPEDNEADPHAVSQAASQAGPGPSSSVGSRGRGRGRGRGSRLGGRPGGASSRGGLGGRTATTRMSDPGPTDGLEYASSDSEEEDQSDAGMVPGRLRRVVERSATSRSPQAGPPSASLQVGATGGGVCGGGGGGGGGGPEGGAGRGRGATQAAAASAPTHHTPSVPQPAPSKIPGCPDRVPDVPNAPIGSTKVPLDTFYNIRKVFDLDVPSTYAHVCPRGSCGRSPCAVLRLGVSCACMCPTDQVHLSPRGALRRAPTSPCRTPSLWRPGTLCRLTQTISQTVRCFRQLELEGYA